MAPNSASKFIIRRRGNNSVTLFRLARPAKPLESGLVTLRGVGGIVEWF